MRVLGVIPARKGSKGVPRKNIRNLAGKPLVKWVLEAASHVKELDFQVVTTDDPEVERLTIECGIQVLKRPSDLAQDKIPMKPVLVHALQTIEAQQGMGRFEWVMCIQPTYPFLTPDRIRQVISAGRTSTADSITTLVSASFDCHPYNARVIDKDGFARLAFPAQKAKMPQRQNAPHFFFFGNLVMTRRKVLHHGDTLYGETSHPILIEPWEALDINSELDFQVCDMVMGLKEEGYRNGPWGEIIREDR